MSEEIKKRLDGFLSEGMSLYDEVVGDIEQTNKSIKNWEAGIEVFDLFKPTGKKTASKKFSKEYIKRSHEQRMREYKRRFEDWFSEVKSYIKTIRKKPRDLSRQTTSANLLTKFNQVYEAKGLEVKLRRAIASLKKIHEYDLIIDSELAELKKKYEAKKKKKKTTKKRLTTSSKTVLKKEQEKSKVNWQLLGIIIAIISLIVTIVLGLL